ncbi:MAG: response regulator [Deltaproteobacteria bacterium]|nr:response regulator [Deltaproteobacteria bacterium]
MNLNKDIKVLVVDDSVGIRLAAKKIMVNLGFNNTVVAEDGDVALEMLLKEPYDLVIADWNMPRMSGLELLVEMRKNEKIKDTPFLLATGDEEQETLVKAIKAGANYYMKKPYDAKILLERIEHIFEFRDKIKQRKETKKPVKPLPR